MEGFLLKIDSLFERIGSFLKHFEKFLHGEFMGFEVFTFFALGMFVVILCLLYFLMQSRIKRLGRRFRSLEDKFEGFKDEINLTIASLKAKSPVSKKGPEGVLDEMLGSEKPAKPSVQETSLSEAEPVSKEEVTGVRSIDEPEGFFEKTSDEQDQPKPEMTEDKDLESSEASSGDDGPVPALEGDKKSGKGPVIEADKEVSDLFEGLDDVSSPYSKPSEQSSKEKELAAEKGIEVVKPLAEVPQEKVEVKGADSSQSWEDKTALKSSDEDIVKVKAEDAIEMDLEELSEAKPKAAEDEQPEEDRTKIDSIDQNIDFGSEEISINFDEPHRTIDAQGVVAEDRRNSQRVSEEVDIEMIFEGFTDFIQECSVDISTGGMFVKSEKTQPVGTRIKLDVKLKDGYKLIKGDAEVIRTEEGGMGLKFVNLDDESKSLVNKIVEQKQA